MLLCHYQDCDLLQLLDYPLVWHLLRNGVKLCFEKWMEDQDDRLGQQMHDFMKRDFNANYVNLEKGV
jgi:hypothetical protein